MVVEDKELAAPLLPAPVTMKKTNKKAPPPPGCQGGQPVGAPHRRHLSRLLARGAPPHPPPGNFNSSTNNSLWIDFGY
jgi:hypothetical protein